MALSNAERQKRYRETRKQKVSELDMLRNEIKLLQSQLQLAVHARDNFSNHNRQLASDSEKLRNENQELQKELQELRAARKKSPKLIPLKTFDDSFFYVYEGQLKLLEWPETEETIKAKGLDCVPCSKVYKKYMKAIQALIDEHNEKVESLNADILNGR
ncbi:hypothetical protein [Rheinheimera sp.]|uniref:hypothetical protein n=1 Tax=Rheinheimera sp. TaxID=1869214 RepID=UPI004048863D